MLEPVVKRAAIFVDGQNLFHAAKRAFGHHYPNYDIGKLAEAVCRQHSWSHISTAFYTGIPSRERDPSRHDFWTAKLLFMRRQGIQVFSRPLRYSKKKPWERGFARPTEWVGREKGIDTRIALDIIRGAIENRFDIAVIFSQDQDFEDVAGEIRYISRKNNRWIKIASAFPASPAYSNRRGVNKTDWIEITRGTYNLCLDPWDYRKGAKR